MNDNLKLDSTRYLAADRTDPLDRTVFVLNQTQWDTLVALLNAPPQPNPRLERLLNAPDIFERR